MKLPRRKFLHLAAGAAALPVFPRAVGAQTYPTRPVTIIVPFAAGGGTDVSARIVGDYMSRTLGQQFIIENVPGAGGTTGSIRAMRAKADGYTILMGHIGTMPSRSRSTPTSHISQMLISSQLAWLLKCRNLSWHGRTFRRTT